MLRRIGASLLVVALVACGGGEEMSEPILLETPGKGHVRRIQRVKLDMTLTGERGFRYQGETRLRYEEIATAVPVSLWFLSVSAPTDPPITVPDGRQILFTADLAPGLYRGSPGTYEMSGRTQGDVLGVPTNIESAAYITVTTLQPKLASETYDLRNARYEKPCTLTVGKDLRTGSVGCPKLADENGKTVSLSWTWEMI